ncbi:hypothetical protein DOY81_005267 [Sarcophaga bullata]|nr:hypothetical protein DOY81_005267 [Sarcophaga bullata]
MVCSYLDTMMSNSRVIEMPQVCKILKTTTNCKQKKTKKNSSCGLVFL